MLALIRKSLRFVFWIQICSLVAFGASAPVRVACVGDSITFGVGVKERIYTFPSRLARMLGPDYEVRNFGVSGATLLKQSNRPYTKQKAYTEALDYKPDIVVIKLGTNDSKHPGAPGAYAEDAPDNWGNKEEFISDYKDLIAAFRKANPAVKVYVCFPVPAYPGFGGIDNKVIHDEVLPRIRQVAQETGATLVDCYTALSGKPECFPDTVHPNVEGARLIAATIYRSLTGHEPAPAPEPALQSFVHPGLLHSQQDMQRIRKALAAGKPDVAAAFALLKAHPQSQSNYALQGPREEIGAKPDQGREAYESDASAAYQCALMWCLTGEKPYAAKSSEILNAWAGKLQTISGPEAVLVAGSGAFKMANAAELLRYSGAEWPQTEVLRTEQHFRLVIYPVLKDFALYANGSWDATAMKAVLAIGVFCNDRAMVERCLSYYQSGAGNGALTHYISARTGQSQESGRAIGSAQMGLGDLAECCEVAWHQGIDLYGLNDNRLLKGFEYVASQNLGKRVAFVRTPEQTGLFDYVSPAAAGAFQPIYEMVYGHYHGRRGLGCGALKAVIKQVRPEGPAAGAGHPGFGTLLFSLDASEDIQSLGAAPGGLVVQQAPTRNTLSWVGVAGVKSYVVKRSVTANGPYHIIARNCKTTGFADAEVQAGKLYTYVVSANGAKGESADSVEAAVYSGLPAPWTLLTVGPRGQEGTVDYDGHVFALQAAGAGLGASGDEFAAVGAPLQGDGGVAAHVLPPFNAQSTTLGVILRDGTAPDAPCAALVITPVKDEASGSPVWSAQLKVRAAAGQPMSQVGGSLALGKSLAAFGRLLNPCWLRLERRDGQIQAWLSEDGKKWTLVGNATKSPLGDKVLGAALAASGRAGLLTHVNFEKVAVSNGSLLPAKEKKSRSL